MFQAAIKQAMDFTFPVVVSARFKDGNVSSSIAAFTVINDEGWVLTAAHVVEQLKKLAGDKQSAEEHEAKVAEVRSDQSLSKSERGRRLRSIGEPPGNPVVNFSSWWGRNEWTCTDFHVKAAADLAVGKISGFDSSHVSSYPTFKNPDVEFGPGVNLCKLGFPFHCITPGYDENTGTFRLSPAALPTPFFPIEGMFTRTVVKVGEEGTLPVQFVETSSPGLVGQSGGPTFDTGGRIWAVQSNTVHYPLGFSPNAPGLENQEHQFLNVGIGAHVRTIIDFLEFTGVKYTVSED